MDRCPFDFFQCISNILSNHKRVVFASDRGANLHIPVTCVHNCDGDSEAGIRRPVTEGDTL